MRNLTLLMLHLLTTLAQLLRPGGARAVIAETLVVKHQLLILNRCRRRAPNLTTLDRVVMGLCTLFMNPSRVCKVAAVLKPATLLSFRQALKARKYRRLFSSQRLGKPGPKGHSKELIAAIFELKRRNPRFGCPRIAQQFARTFSVDIDKDVVRRVLAKHYRPEPDTGGGPSWLTFIGHMKDSLWSVDLFRCESISLKTHWVLVVMDQFTRRIIGFGVQASDVNGVALCRMFNQSISGMGVPKHLSSDNDPLFTYHQWQANLRILDVDEIKTVPHIPWSHPFVERLIGSLWRELLDQVFFWNSIDLERKLEDFKQYYNRYRVHSTLDGLTPEEAGGHATEKYADLHHFAWQSHCRGLYALPIAA